MPECSEPHHHSLLMPINCQTQRYWVYNELKRQKKGKKITSYCGSWYHRMGEGFFFLLPDGLIVNGLSKRSLIIFLLQIDWCDNVTIRPHKCCIQMWGVWRWFIGEKESPHKFVLIFRTGKSWVAPIWHSSCCLNETISDVSGPQARKV